MMMTDGIGIVLLMLIDYGITVVMLLVVMGNYDTMTDEMPVPIVLVH